MTVTPPKPKDNLATAAALLSKAAPNRWKEFMEAYDVYTREIRDACVVAAADQVLKTQGRAQHATELQILLTDAAKQK